MNRRMTLSTAAAVLAAAFAVGATLPARADDAP